MKPPRPAIDEKSFRWVGGWVGGAGDFTVSSPQGFVHSFLIFKIARSEEVGFAQSRLADN